MQRSEALPAVIVLLALLGAVTIKADGGEAGLLSWIEEHGGQVNVNITRGEHGVRGTYAPAAMAEGDILAVIPFELAFLVPSGGASGEMGLYLLRDIYNSSSFFQPYWAALPPKHDIGINYETFPDEYLELLESEDMAKEVRGYKENTAYVWQQVKDTIGEELGADLQLDDLQYTTALVVSRYFGYLKESYMIPIIDMANHDNECLHYHQLENCEEGVDDRMCFVWRAGKDLVEGEEVCNTYGVLRNDEALLQYGFLLPHNPALLCTIDHHEYSPGAKTHRSEDLPAFTGTAEQLQAEMDRLLELQAALGPYDEERANVIPFAPSDGEGQQLAYILEFQKLRREAIAAELQRLEQELAVTSGTAEEEVAMEELLLLQEAGAEEVAVEEAVDAAAAEEGDAENHSEL